MNSIVLGIRKVSKGAHALGAIILSVIFLLIVYEVFARPLGYSFEGVGELTESLIVWSIFLALPVVTAQGRHIKVDLIVRLLPEKVQKILHIISNIICMLMGMLLLWKGIVLVIDSYKYTTRTVMLDMPEWILKIVLPVSMVLFILELLIDTVIFIKTPAEKEKKIESKFEEAEKEEFVE